MKQVGRHSSLAKELARLKDARARRQDGRFLVEGLGTLKEALVTGALELLLVDREDAEMASAAAAADVEVVLAAEGLLERLAPSRTPQGVLGVARSAPVEPLEALAGACVLFLEDVADPGNVGTLLRTAWACGVQGVIVDQGADPLGPKVVRASAGAVFHLKIARGSVDALDTQGHELVAAVVRGGQDLFSSTFAQRSVLMVGNEARGLSAPALHAASRYLTIPMWGGCESLNVSVSGSLLLYEYRRKLTPKRA